MGERESLLAHLRHIKMVAEKYSVRHVFGFQHSLENCDPDNVYWFPGSEHSAGALAKSKSDMVPLRRLLESGAFRLGILRPLI